MIKFSLPDYHNGFLLVIILATSHWWLVAALLLLLLCSAAAHSSAPLKRAAVAGAWVTSVTISNLTPPRCRPGCLRHRSDIIVHSCMLAVISHDDLRARPCWHLLASGGKSSRRQPSLKQRNSAGGASSSSAAYLLLPPAPTLWLARCVNRSEAAASITPVLSSS